MTGPGTVIVDILPGVVTGVNTNLVNAASTSIDNNVSYDNVHPVVTINQSANQDDPTRNTTVHFTAVFSKPVIGFDSTGVAMSGTALPSTITITDSGDSQTFDVALSGFAQEGTVIANITQGICHDANGNINLASTSTDNVVTFQTAPTVTVSRGATQSDPAFAAPILFDIVFNKDVINFNDTGITIKGTTGGTKVVTLTPIDARTYTASIDGMTTAGTVIVSVPSGVASDKDGYANTASNNVTVTFQPAPPSVTINQAADQLDPATDPAAKFTAVFNQIVTGFDAADIIISGTAGATNAVVTDSGDGKTYTVSITGNDSKWNCYCINCRWSCNK